MTASEDQLVLRLTHRGYTLEKIDENIAAQRADTIYYEALEGLPSSRIFRVSNDDGMLDAAYQRVKAIISGKV